MIRRLRAADLALWRAFAADAVATSPESFTTTAEEVRAQTDDAVRADLEARPVLGLFEEGRLLGCIALRPMEGAAVAHRAGLGNVYVAPERRGRGDSDRLMEAAVSLARDAGHLQLELYVLAGNARAIRLYERHGFRIAGRLPRSVRRGDAFEDDLHMVRRLD